MVEFYIKFEKLKKCFNSITNTKLDELSAVLILFIIKFNTEFYELLY